MSGRRGGSRYAPRRDDGLKPWVVTRREWGRSDELIVYANSRAAAEHEVKGRRLHVTASGRRATFADMERLGQWR